MLPSCVITLSLVPLFPTLEDAAVLLFAQPYDVSLYHRLGIMEGQSPPMLPSLRESTLIQVSLYSCCEQIPPTQYQSYLGVLFISSAFPFCCPFEFCNFLPQSPFFIFFFFLFSFILLFLFRMGCTSQSSGTHFFSIFYYSPQNQNLMLIALA